MGKLAGGNKYPEKSCPVGIKRVDYKYGSYNNNYDNSYNQQREEYERRVEAENQRIQQERRMRALQERERNRQPSVRENLYGTGGCAYLSGC